MRKLVLRWLFGTEKVEDYLKVLSRAYDINNERASLIREHIETLEREKEALDIALRLIEVCKNHGVPFDEAFKQTEPKVQRSETNE